MQDTNSTVLIGYDGSDDAAAAIRCAGTLLAPRPAMVAYVWDSLAELLLHTDIDTLTGPMVESAQTLDEEEAQDARAIAERGAALADEAGFSAVPVIGRGKPKAWPTLLKLAEKHEAAAIVVGSRGLGGVQSALLGSVSSGVLDHAHLPVLVVPPVEDEHRAGPVVVGYDGSAAADAAIVAAGRLLRVRETIVQTVWRSCADAAGAGAAAVPVAVATKASEQLDTEFRLAAEETARRGTRLAVEQGLEARAEAVPADGGIWYPLCDTARAKGAAAIVVGSRGRSRIGAALMGSVSRALVHHAPAPVLVVRPPAS